MLGVAILVIFLIAAEGRGALSRDTPGPSVIVVGAGMSGEFNFDLKATLFCRA